ncbi:amidohydrolase [Pseudoalteromonas sp. MMG013]|uniref:amidohydrolase family protein n=1 Tax=Pseudoalteromonas sp. MMG013 TaxID=2822687 RepID=UPI001B388457|nr:amidohydrolase family protein [Pseudoalteromonas sp. MMG013]MBQ4860694.1 amidohydrolase [Pseudoalteromonas sp. MMG013]
MYKVIDCDRHVMEPIDLWEQYVDPEVFKRDPVHLNLDTREKQAQRHTKTGYDLPLPPTYMIGSEPILGNWGEEQQIATALINSSSNTQRSLATFPAGQIKSMDDVGVSVAMLFPTFAGYIVNHKDVSEDSSLAYAHAYNQWIENFCSTSPERLMPVGLISRHSPSTLSTQVKDIALKGWRAITIRPEPILGKTLGDPEYADFWAACEKYNITVTFHGGTHLQGNTVGTDRFNTRFSLHACSHPMEAQMAFVTLLESGVLERHPQLKFAFLEAGCSWVAHWLWRLDNICYNEFPSLTQDNITMLPSEYFKRQFWVGIEIGEPISDTLKAIGHEKMIFGSDFPHPDHLHFELCEISKSLPELSTIQISDILEKNPKELFSL